MASEVVQLSIVLVRAGDEWRAHLAEDLRTSAAGATQGDYVKTTMLDVALEPGARFRLSTDALATLFIYLVEGAGRFGDSDKEIASHQALLFGAGDEFAAQAGENGVRFVLVAGRPLREPIAWGGPIVMNTREELDQAFEEIDNGTFIREARTDT